MPIKIIYNEFLILRCKDSLFNYILKKIKFLIDENEISNNLQQFINQTEICDFANFEEYPFIFGGSTADINLANFFRTKDELRYFAYLINYVIKLCNEEEKQISDSYKDRILLFHNRILEVVENLD